MNIRLMICLILAACTLATPASGAEINNSPEEPAQMDLTSGATLYTVGYAHLDTQWRWCYPMTIRDFLPDTMRQNFLLFEKYPSYIFNFSGSNRYRMMQEYFPEDYERVKGYVAAGRWFPCGSSVEECDVNTVSAESVIRQVLYGNHFFNTEFNKSSAEFMLPDCFGFPASLPSLLSHSGLKGFSTQKLTWGSATGIPFNVGVWEGLDGRRLVCALNPGSYGGQVHEDLSNNADWLARITKNGDTSSVYADYFYYGTGDVGGSPTPGTVEWIERSAAGDGPVRIVASPADQLFKDITPAQAAKLPTYQGDLMLTQHSAGSITSQAYMKRWNRKGELLADSAERAAVTANWLGTLGYPQDKLNHAWNLVMGGQFHDILPGTSHPEAYNYSWNDEVLAQNQFADVLTSAVGAVSAGLDTTTTGVPLIVYNALSIEREDIVEAGVEFAVPPAAVRVVGPDGGETPAQIIKVEGTTVTILFLARVPAVGFAVFDVQPAAAGNAVRSELSASESAVENADYRVELDANGDVASIYDKQAQRELLAAPLRLAFTTDVPGYWPAWNIDWDDQQLPPRSYLDGPAQVRVVENGPVRVALEIERVAEDSRFVQTVSLAAGEAGRRVGLGARIDWRGQACNLKAEFPLTVSNPQATYNWEAGTIQRGNNDEKKYEVPTHQWIDLTDTGGAYGVTVLSPFKFGSDKPADNVVRLTLLRTPGCPSTDYADEATQDWGRHEISYGLVGHSGDYRESQTDWQAYSLEQPLVAFATDAHAGALGKTLCAMAVSNPRVRVLALKQAEDTDELIVRLVELDGRDANAVRVAFPAAVTSAREVDGQERPLGEATVEDGALVVDFTPFALHTFALRLEQSATTLEPIRQAPLILPFDTCVASGDNMVMTGGFDGSGRCLPAEMLPERLTDAGVDFAIFSTRGEQSNAVACQGQTLDLPAGGYNRLYMIGAASNGDQTVEFLVDGEPTELVIQDWGGFIGQWDNRVWSGAVAEMAFRWDHKCLGITPGFTKRAPVAWYSSHRHDGFGRNLIYDYCYLYRYAIDLPAGARSLTLPDNERVKLMALTAVTDTGGECQPAQPLYDTLDDQATDWPLPELQPVAGKK